MRAEPRQEDQRPQRLRVSRRHGLGPNQRLLMHHHVERATHGDGYSDLSDSCYQQLLAWCEATTPGRAPEL